MVASISRVSRWSKYSVQLLAVAMGLGILILPMGEKAASEVGAIRSEYPAQKVFATDATGPPSDLETGILGTWIEELEGARVEVVLNKNGTFTRILTDSSGAEIIAGTYRQTGNWLFISPEGYDLLRFEIVQSGGGRLIIRADDGNISEMVRTPTPHEKTRQPRNPPSENGIPDAGPRADHQIAPPRVPTTGEHGKGSGERAKGRTGAQYGEIVPGWVRPGMRMTFYLMTGSLPGSVSGWVPDEEGRWIDRTGRRYSQERKGHSSHGLLQATVAGMDAETAALSQIFYLFSGDDTTPFLKNSMDSLVTPDTGGDYWMHPNKQAALLRSNPWNHVPQSGEMVAKEVRWKGDNREWNATAVAIIGEASKTTYIFDQESGCLLYLSRLTRHSPEIRDPSQGLPDSVSYATFLRFISMRQLNVPWLSASQAETFQRLQAVSYQGTMRIDFPGAMHTPSAITQDLTALKRGVNWVIFQGRSQTQGTVMANDFKAVQGPGCTPPLIIPPASLGAVHQGAELDRDPATGFTLRYLGADTQTFSLSKEGPRQHFTYVYDRRNGLLVRLISREIINPSTPDMVTIRDLSLAGWR